MISARNLRYFILAFVLNILAGAAWASQVKSVCSSNTKDPYFLQVTVDWSSGAEIKIERCEISDPSRCSRVGKMPSYREEVFLRAMTDENQEIAWSILGDLGLGFWTYSFLSHYAEGKYARRLGFINVDKDMVGNSRLIVESPEIGRATLWHIHVPEKTHLIPNEISKKIEKGYFKYIGSYAQGPEGRTQLVEKGSKLTDAALKLFQDIARVKRIRAAINAISFLAPIVAVFAVDEMNPYYHLNESNVFKASYSDFPSQMSKRSSAFSCDQKVGFPGSVGAYSEKMGRELDKMHIQKELEQEHVEKSPIIQAQKIKKLDESQAFGPEMFYAHSAPHAIMRK